MRKANALLLVPLCAQLLGCSYSYPIWATMVGGRIAFDTGDKAYNCFTNIHVAARGSMASDPAIEAIADPMKKGEAMERARTAWQTDYVQTYECKGYFPVVYGAPQAAEAVIVPAKPLRIGVPYEVSTFGPKGWGGTGCFRINADRRPENLPDQDCLYGEEAGSAPAPSVAAVAVPSQPLPQPPAPPRPAVATPQRGQGRMLIANSPSAQAAVAVGPGAMSAQPINAMPPPDETGPSQMYALTPYRGIERYLRDYPSLAACERARAEMARAAADRRMCGFGPRRP